MAKNWTEEEEEHIRRSFLTQTYGELAEHFGVTTKAMESKIRRLGLKKQEMLAETEGLLEPDTIVEYEEPSFLEDPSPTPIESIHTLQRRVELHKESKEERAERLRVTQEAAEVEKARRQEARANAPMTDAIKKFEAGVKHLLGGKHEEAAKKFQAILDDPPNDLGLVMRTRQYLAAAEAKDDAAPTLKTADDMYRHAVVLVNNGEFVEAVEILDQAWGKDPKDDRIMYVRAIAMALSEDDEAALEALSAAIAINDVNRVYAGNDPDFSSLSGNPDFQELVAPPADGDDEE